ncbi:MAG: hypothetical protein AAGC65_26045, partial [Mucilaginibacter sp.]
MLESEKFIFQQGYVRHAALLKWLNNHQCDKRLLDEPQQAICLPMAQFICLHAVCQKFKPELDTLPQIRQYMSKTFPFKNLMNDWWQRGKMIVYLEFFGLNSWSVLAKTHTKQPGEIHLLEGSLGDCHISIQELFDFIHQVNAINNYPGSLYNTGEQLYLKLKNDPGFAQLLLQEMPRIIKDEVLRQLLPGILRGLINENDTLFHEHLKSLFGAYDADHAPELLIALTVACPGDHNCRKLLIDTLQTYHSQERISTATYIQALNVGKFNDAEIRQELTAMAEQEQTAEVATQLLSYLQANLTEHEQAWFKRIATALIVRPEEQLVGMLQLLLNLLTEYNLPLIYELM